MKTKYIFIIVTIILILIVALVVFLPKPKSPSVVIPAPTSIFPTKYVIKPSSIPNLIPPTDFTGVKEETLPPEIINLTQEKQNLKKKVPISQASFMINFDYEQDKFIVNLNEPKSESQVNFEKWRENYYPNIPTDRFLLK